MLQRDERFNKVMFSSLVRKTNKFNKCADRALLVTDTAIYKLDTAKFKPMKKGMPIQEVSISFVISFYSPFSRHNSTDD